MTETTPQALEGVVLFLEQLAHVNAKSPSLRSPFHSTHTPPMTIRLYCERILKYSKCSPEAFVVGMLLLCKFSFFARHPITIFNVHRLLITSTLIAAKMRDDEYFANTYYARIGGIPTDELNALEVHFLSMLHWDMWIGEEEYECAAAMLGTIAEACSSRSSGAAVTAHQHQQLQPHHHHHPAVTVAANAAVASAEMLSREIWSNWLSSFESQTHRRRSRLAEILSNDASVEAAKQNSAVTMPSVILPPPTPTLRSASQRTTPAGSSAGRSAQLPHVTSQSSVGHCESVASLDNFNQKPVGQDSAQGSDNSRAGSGSLGSCGQSPHEGAPSATLESGTSAQSRSWANVARSKAASSGAAALRADDCEAAAAPTTPTSTCDSNFSSQQVTPNRMLTKQRFHGSRGTPTNSRRQMATNWHADAAANGLGVLRQTFPPPPQPATSCCGGFGAEVPPPATSAAVVADVEAKREGKKRPKPDSYRDYR